MKAYSRDSKYISENFEQEEGDGDWVTQTPTIETTLEKISIHSDTTATQIVTYDKDSVAMEVGDKLLVNDGGVWKEITIENITYSAGASTMSVNDTFSYRSSSTNSSPLMSALGYNPSATKYNSGHGSFSPDGLRCWITTNESTYQSLVQLDLSTPYNLRTIVGKNSLPYVYANGASYGNGFFFANKGKYLFTNDTPSGAYLRRYLLATPYDITTASRPSQQYNPNAMEGVSYSFNGGAFNDDGTKFIVKHLNTVFYGTTAIPFNISYATAVYNYGSYPHTLSFTHDGKYMVELDDDTATYSSAFFKVFDMSNDPCNLSTAAVTTNYVTVNPSYWFSTGNNTYSKLIISQNLEQIVIVPQGYATQAFHSLTTTLGTKTTIDISTQGLVNPPTDGDVYLATRPTLKIAASPRTEAFTYNRQLVHTDTTTTSSKIHYEKSGLLASGDTVLFDNVNSVQLTSVTETTSDATLTNSMKYAGQYATGKSMINNHNEGGWGPHFQLSTDGNRLFVLQGASTAGTSYDSGIHIYDLSIPWDISTATLSGVNENRHIFDWANLMTESSASLPSYTVAAGPVFGSGSQYNSCGFQFSPDGTKLTVGLVLSTSYPQLRVITFTLLDPWNLFSIISEAYPATAYTGSTTTTTFWRDIFFNTDGSQLILVDDANSYTSSDLKYHPYPTSTPWDGAGAVPSTANDTSSMITLTSSSTARLITRFTPDGKRLISLGYSTGSNDILNGMYANLAPNSYNNISGSGWPSSGSWTTFAYQSWWPSSITSNFTGQVTDHRFSPDGKRWYIMMNNGTIHQIDGNFNVDPGVMYNITYPTQSVAPTTIHIPDQSIEQSLTFGAPTSINSSYGNVVYTGSQENISGTRSVRFELDGPTSIDFQIDTVRIDLEKGV